MKHTTTFASFLMALTCSPFLRADTAVEWSQVCATTQRNPLIVTTTTGETVDGYCERINVDEITLRSRTADGKIVKVAKSAISGLMVHRVRAHRLLSLFKGLGQGFKDGTALLFSPLAPFGIVVLPGTVAWGAVASPFCLIGDGVDLLKRDYAITVK